MDIVASAGPWIYPLVAVAALMVVAILRAWSIIFSDEPLPPAPPHNAVVAWGAVALLVGFLGTVVGIARLTGGLQAVFEDVDPEIDTVLELLAEGAAVVAGPVVIGLGLLIASVLAWMLLGWLLNVRRREPPSSQPDM